MSNIISFEDKKEDKELIELLEQFEKHMPTKEELEARIFIMILTIQII